MLRLYSGVRVENSVAVCECYLFVRDERDAEYDRRREKKEVNDV